MQMSTDVFGCKCRGLKNDINYYISQSAGKVIFALYGKKSMAILQTS